MDRFEDELRGQNHVVQLNVARRHGDSGRVVARWAASGDHNGEADIFPVAGTVEPARSLLKLSICGTNVKSRVESGVESLPQCKLKRNFQVEFADGQTVATITITIRDDTQAEVDERSVITLTEILEPGTDLPGKGAVIGKTVICHEQSFVPQIAASLALCNPVSSAGSARSATLTVLANDSPHGVVSWERSKYVTPEPDGSDAVVTLHVVRQQGSEGHIRVAFA